MAGKLNLTPGRRIALTAARDGLLYRRADLACFIAGGHFARVSGVTAWLVDNGLVVADEYRYRDGRWWFRITPAGEMLLVPPDRHVHAESVTAEIVHYGRDGFWYLEPKSGEERQRLTVAEAAGMAKVLARLGGEIHRGLPGGLRFDYLVQP